MESKVLAGSPAKGASNNHPRNCIATCISIGEFTSFSDILSFYLNT